MCVCVCARARARVCVCVCVRECMRVVNDIKNEHEFMSCLFVSDSTHFISLVHTHAHRRARSHTLACLLIRSLSRCLQTCSSKTLLSENVWKYSETNGITTRETISWCKLFCTGYTLYNIIFFKKLRTLVMPCGHFQIM